jgi:NAD(P)-dependent dehydrogenase (short-subunit alcohol dehydrogenase family)
MARSGRGPPAADDYRRGEGPGAVTSAVPGLGGSVRVPDPDLVSHGDGRLEGETAIVTGGAAGIGRAVAMMFAAEGAQVAIADIDGQAAATVAGGIRRSGGNALAVETDVSDEASVTRMAQAVAAELGVASILASNAAGDPVDDLLAMGTAGWQRDLQLTLTGPFLCTRAVLPGMLGGGHGCIVNVVSLNAFIALGNEAYSAAKAGLVSLTRSAAVRYGPRGVRANAIAPGTILTYAPNQKQDWPATPRCSSGCASGIRSAGPASPMTLPTQRCSCAPARQPGSPTSCCGSTAGCWPGTCRSPANCMDGQPMNNPAHHRARSPAGGRLPALPASQAAPSSRSTPARSPPTAPTSTGGPCRAMCPRARLPSES